MPANVPGINLGVEMVAVGTWSMPDDEPKEVDEQDDED